MSRIPELCFLGLAGLMALSQPDACAQATAAGGDAPATTLWLRSGLTDNALPTAEWLAMVSVFNNDETLEKMATTAAPLTAEELAWQDLIQRRSEIWPATIQALRLPFGDVLPPAEVGVVLGKSGGSDAFVIGEKTIGFDLGRLFREYGSADLAANQDRIDRFFAHEYTHLLHKAWRSERSLALTSPLEQALWACLTEGLGNYYSLTSRWRDDDGNLTAHAEAVLLRLQPVFAERLGALEHARGAQAEALTKGLSMGPFDQKWGGLTVALWLSQEAGGQPSQLRHWVELGPWGVLMLAEKHLPAALAAKLPTAQPADQAGVKARQPLTPDEHSSSRPDPAP